jgi:hypothetical protein
MVTEVCLILRKVSRNEVAKIVRRRAEERAYRVGRQAETSFIEFLKEDRQLIRHTEIIFFGFTVNYRTPKKLRPGDSFSITLGKS